MPTGGGCVTLHRRRRWKTDVAIFVFDHLKYVSDRVVVDHAGLVGEHVENVRDCLFLDDTLVVGVRGKNVGHGLLFLPDHRLGGKRLGYLRLFSLVKERKDIGNGDLVPTNFHGSKRTKNKLKK